MKKNSKADFIFNMPNKWENCENQQFSADFIRNMPKGDWKKAMEDEKYLRENRNKGKFDCENQQFSADFILNTPKGNWKKAMEDEKYLKENRNKGEFDCENQQFSADFILNMPKGNWKKAMEDEKYLKENRNKGEFERWLIHVNRIEKLEKDIDNLKQSAQSTKYYLCLLYILGFATAVVVMFSSCQ